MIAIYIKVLQAYYLLSHSERARLSCTSSSSILAVCPLVLPEAKTHDRSHNVILPNPYGSTAALGPFSYICLIFTCLTGYITQTPSQILTRDMHLCYYLSLLPLLNTEFAQQRNQKQHIAHTRQLTILLLLFWYFDCQQTDVISTCRHLLYCLCISLLFGGMNS